MKVIQMAELVYSEPRPKTPEERQAKYDGILASLECPMYLGRVTTVGYDVKSDRYALTFIPAQDKKLVLKASNEVAQFVGELVSESGYWQGRMESGVLVEVNLIKAG